MRRATRQGQGATCLGGMTALPARAHAGRAIVRLRQLAGSVKPPPMALVVRVQLSGVKSIPIKTDGPNWQIEVCSIANDMPDVGRRA
jgi:hypothetical protein